jgi:hypothetical protein
MLKKTQFWHCNRSSEGRRPDLPDRALNVIRGVYSDYSLFDALALGGLSSRGRILGLFERFLTVWVGLGILAGVGLGLWAPDAFTVIAGLEFAHVNLVVAVLIWIMIYPMMIQIDWSSIKQVGQKPRGLLLTLVVNWLIKPFMRVTPWCRSRSMTL